MSSGAPYAFVTQWQVAAPIDAVWDVLIDSGGYPSWWKAVLSVTPIEPGGPDGTGQVDRFVWRAPLGYRLQFDMRVTSVVRPTRLSGTASGELEGTGIWSLREDGGRTMVRYEWNVRTKRPWMNALAPIARPVFKRSHDAVMASGASGLATLLSMRVPAGA